MKKVLLVDDDKSFLQSLIDGFKAYEDKFTITTAGDGVEAVIALEKETINLVLTDLKMPRMDGFELVAHLSSNYPDTPVIVMTAFGTPEMEESLHAMGTIQYIEKPIDFAMLVEKIINGLKAPSSQGYITGVSLSSFLQLLEIDKKTCTLTIRTRNKKGYMHFKEGELLDASYNQLQGSDAAFEIVSWKNVEIAMDSSCSATENKISQSLGFILLEGCRRTDENNVSEVPSGPGATEQSFGDLDALNMADLDLNLSNKAPTQQPAAAPAAQSPSPAQAGTATDNPILSQFISMLNSFPEIESATVSGKDGSTLHQSGTPDSNTANFITYVAVAVEQIQTTIGASGRQYAIFTLTDSSKLIILCGPEVTVGLKVGSSVFPAPIADGLRPILRRITLST